MSVSHLITQFNQGGPCRPSPTQAERPSLSDDEALRESLTQGIMSLTSGAISEGSINGEKESLRLIESNISSQPATERAACVPDTRFVRVSAVLAEMGPIRGDEDFGLLCEALYVDGNAGGNG